MTSTKILLELDFTLDKKSCVSNIYTIRFTRSKTKDRQSKFFDLTSDYNEKYFNYLDILTSTLELAPQFILAESYHLNPKKEALCSRFLDDTDIDKLFQYNVILNLLGLEYSILNCPKDITLLKSCTTFKIANLDYIDCLDHIYRDVLISKLSDKKTSAKAEKYIRQKYRLFSLFDHGIQFNEEGLFSVTPEALAFHQAKRIKRSLRRLYPKKKVFHILDVCCGLGGNSIQFANQDFYVTAVDINKDMIDYCLANAEVYEVAEFITPVNEDIFEWGEKVMREHEKQNSQEPPFDAVFCSPPWGGPEYYKKDAFTLDKMFGGMPDMERLATLCSRLSNGAFAFFLPKNTEFFDMFRLITTMSQTFYHDPSPNLQAEIEQNFIGYRLKAITLYCGHLADFVPTEAGANILEK